MENWIVFHHCGNEIGSCTVRGLFEGEIQDTVNLIANECGINPDDIQMFVEYR